MTVSGQRPEQGYAERGAVGFVVLTFEFQKEGHLWVGRCVELGTATDGRSLEKVDAEPTELVILHMNALEEVGERERFFAEHEMKLYTPRPPTEVDRRVLVSEKPKLIDFRSVRVPAPKRGKELAEV